MTLYVIEEKYKDQIDIIGVADSKEQWLKMIDEYFGKGEYKVLKTQDIRDSGIEYIYHIKHDKSKHTVVIRDYLLNEI